MVWLKRLLWRFAAFVKGRIVFQCTSTTEPLVTNDLKSLNYCKGNLTAIISLN